MSQVQLDTTPPPPVADPAAAVSEVPAGVPEKFVKDGKVDVAALAQSYTELEKKATPPAAAPPPVATLKPDAPALDLKALAAEMEANGGALKPETLTALEKQGHTADVVKTQLANAQAAATKFVNDLSAPIGGVEALRNLYTWAEANLTKEEQEGYNAIVEQGNLATASLALAGLKARFEATVGVDPKLIKGEGVPTSSGVKPYASQEESQRDFRDPKYKTDPAFREKVARRLAVTPSANKVSTRYGKGLK